MWYGKGNKCTVNCKTFGPYISATFLTVGQACLESGHVKSTKAVSRIGAVGSPPLKTKPNGRLGKGICDATATIRPAETARNEGAFISVTMHNFTSSVQS